MLCRASKVVVVTQSNPYECLFISDESTRANTNSHQRNNLLTHVDEITHLAWLSKSNWLSATSSVSFTLNLIRWMVLDWLLNRYLKPLDSGFFNSIITEWKFTIVWWLYYADSSIAAICVAGVSDTGIQEIVTVQRLHSKNIEARSKQQQRR